MKYTAILFDFDGVLGKTMEDNYSAWAYAFQQFEVRISPEEYFLLEGLNAISVAESLLTKHRISLELAGRMIELKENHYLLNNKFAFYPGVPALIDRLREHFKLALVTGAGRKRLQRTLLPEFLLNFGAVVTGEDVRRPKPDPEPYITASRTLRVEPRDCLVVENAPLGIEAAKKANMECLAVCTTLQDKYLHEADYVVNDTRSMIQFLNGINNQGL